MNAQAGIHSGKSTWDDVVSKCTILVHSFADPPGGRVEIRRVVPCSVISTNRAMRQVGSRFNNSVAYRKR